MNNTNYAGEYTSYEFKEKLNEVKGVMVVCGSCEQHGYHLPLDTDNILGFEMAKRIAEKTNMLVMPPINYGQVWSAKGIPGTISLSSNTLKIILEDIVTSLEKQGVKNIVLYSGHNGNYPVLKEFARDMSDKYEYTNIWYFQPEFSKDFLQDAKSKPCSIPHGGEQETSMLLYLRPDLVEIDKAKEEYPEMPLDFKYRPIHWKEFVSVGTFGNPCVASAEYGKKLVEYSINSTVQIINKLL